ncbi:Rpn family recombination-promoting nuclease/putative transposase [Oceanospirillum beijerinckii]|uniref:Rpn family recombination-promoting nuclease/putative transposase n=1 Tax=Oceanospirillum beijerinckii TaxID=64976 RepID=UPI0009FDE3DB|nr:Rpn family recombination-promoting nuclease/putative transposase [Oceanospirillum beijerinckii]
MLDPKNDFVFKKIFSQAPELLSDLINAVRDDQPAITELEVLNPNIEPEDLTGKHIILDLLAQDVRGKRYNIEMQVRRYNAWSARSAYYLARMLTEQLSRGEDYRQLKDPIRLIYIRKNLETRVFPRWVAVAILIA